MSGESIIIFYFEATEGITEEKIDRFGYMRNCKHMLTTRRK